MTDNRNDSSDDRFFYENYLHKDYYADLPTGRRKTGSGTAAVLFMIWILLAIFCYDSLGVLFIYLLFVLSSKLSGVF